MRQQQQATPHAPAAGNHPYYTKPQTTGASECFPRSPPHVVHDVGAAAAAVVGGVAPPPPSPSPSPSPDRAPAKLPSPSSSSSSSSSSASTTPATPPRPSVGVGILSEHQQQQQQQVQRTSPSSSASASASASPMVSVGPVRLLWNNEFVANLEIQRDQSTSITIPSELNFYEADAIAQEPTDTKISLTARPASIATSDEKDHFFSFLSYLLFHRGNRQTPRGVPKYVVHTFPGLGKVYIVPPALSFCKDDPVTFRLQPSSEHSLCAHPSFLESNARTTHRWVLGALAELIDNSVDAEAAQVHIDWNEEFGQPVILVTDNGHGMTRAEMHGLLQYGHSKTNGEVHIGRFGIGFKTGSMRICKDALVFSISAESASVGILSTTMNESANTVTAPVVTFTPSTMCLDPAYQQDFQATDHLNRVFSVSPIKSQVGLGLVFAKIRALAKKADTQATGTCVMLFNLHNSPGAPNQLELMPDLDKNDIQIRPVNGRNFSNRRGIGKVNVPLDYSLREYLSKLYLTPSSMFFICGKKVESKPVHTSLSNAKRVNSSIPNIGNLTLGYNARDREIGLSGFHLFWHNRLCSSYYKIGSLESKASYVTRGNGVIGVLSVDACEPLNNKQGFNEDQALGLVEEWLSKEVETFLEDNEAETETLASHLDVDDDWVQCNRCLKWRRYPVKGTTFPDQWFCHMNPDQRFNSCQIPQEDASKDKTVSYTNTQVDKTNTPRTKPHSQSSSNKTKPAKTATPKPPAKKSSSTTATSTTAATTKRRKIASPPSSESESTSSSDDEEGDSSGGDQEEKPSDSEDTPHKEEEEEEDPSCSYCILPVKKATN
ncbi:MORC family CW-type zinc finger protein 3-like [Pelomyxa schiedti]|nr:MORC family CW-type zinc finger protein 3-like [Pelomyxa schiedti]